MHIKNYSQFFPGDLSENLSYLRKVGLDCIEIALNSVRPDTLIKKAIRIINDKLYIQNDEFNLKDFEKIFIIGGGKATAEMANAIENLLIASKIDCEGIINIPKGLNVKNLQFSGKIKLNYASHPIPDEIGLNGTKKMIDIIEKNSDKDLIFCLISGGGSALLSLPKKGIILEDLQLVNSLLLASGAFIHEINTVRKHLSNFKGGNLAKKVYNSSKATLISLIISDVVGDQLDSIASGPSVPDLTTYQDSIDILKKYKIYNKIPQSVIKHLEQGLINKMSENPKPNDPCFKRVHNYLIGSVESAIKEIIPYLNGKSFNVDYFSKEIVGEAKEFGILLHNIIDKKLKDSFLEEKISKIALIGTGELTVKIRGKGIGGRNQEMLLSFLNNFKDKPFNYNFLIIAANLDGIEGNSKSMGALIDNYTLEKMIKKNLKPTKFLEINDSNSFFRLVKSELITGQTGCNVNDLLLIFISKKNA